MTTLLVALAVGYLLGSIPFGLVLTRLGGAGDIRSIGSGNIGATNVLRTGRKGLAAATLAFDLLKGFLPVLVAHRWHGLDAALAAGLGAVVGHCFPVWLGFRGGKGVATASGVVLALSWVILVVCLALFVVVFAATRIVSTASLTAAVAAPLLAWWLGEPRMALVLLIIGIIVWVKHGENIGRLMRGEENRFDIGSRKG
ncbi:MAG TPA: glycerol-3-phosphate 1-O-acyltransferase PlsY [Geminicoccaceae bacterium]|nr:glycerol-3-phosphate 1-O-acyltransferase PlsY [Geminicoccus sp.]HMU49886.1 glycerol-3-phosphate 1-O-acyltransferase PlsY [Geminicoccaceae bacterium]